MRVWQTFENDAMEFVLRMCFLSQGAEVKNTFFESMHWVSNLIEMNGTPSQLWGLGLK